MGRRNCMVLFLVLSLMVAVLPGKAYSASALDGFNPDANNDVYSIVLQADGKILVGGGFTNIGGVPRTSQD
jgi:hypothetical protein